MYYQCERPGCAHYAFHFVSSTGSGPKVRVCHYDTSWGIQFVSRAKKRWSRIVVATHSAVVVGDIQAWRTWSLTAYEESRQIKGV